MVATPLDAGCYHELEVDAVDVGLPFFKAHGFIKFIRSEALGVAGEL